MIRSYFSWEGGEQENEPSRSGKAVRFLRQLRDPDILTSDGRTWLFYSVGGERGIARVELENDTLFEKNRKVIDDVSPVADTRVHARVRTSEPLGTENRIPPYESIKQKLLMPFGVNPRLLLIGTHHKTGTVWMRRIFREISEQLEIPFIPVHDPKSWQDKLPEKGRVIVPNWGTQFAKDLLRSPETRIFHLIRDPRDILLSGQRYHETTTSKTEKHLFEPDDEGDGKTYQETMQELDTFDEKLRFEMKGRFKKTMKEMLTWDYDNPRCLDIRYEDLLTDEYGIIFEAVLSFFGFSPDEIKMGMEIFWKNSLNNESTELLGRSKRHVGSGQVAQWKRLMSPAITQEFNNKYQSDLRRLGYEV